MPTVIFDGYACVDCTMMIANGETGDPDHTEEQIEKIAQATAGWCLCSSEGNPDLEFSTTPCRCCGSKLYGTRHFVAKLGETP